MATVGILTFSDGRAFVAEQVEELNRGFQERLKRRLEADGHRVVTGEEIVWTNEGAVREARRLAAAVSGLGFPGTWLNRSWTPSRSRGQVAGSNRRRSRGSGPRWVRVSGNGYLS